MPTSSSRSGGKSYGSGTFGDPFVQDSFQSGSSSLPPQPRSSSKSTSSSFQNSEGSSSSESGEFQSPQQQAWINALYPQIQQRFQGADPQAVANRPWSYYASVGGAPGTFHDIDPTGIWTPEMTQQRVNQMRAQNSSDAGGQLRQTQQRLSGAGFQANSPLFQELAGGIQGRALAASSGGENDLRFQVAEGNAGNVLKGQGLRMQTDTARANDDRNRRAMELAARAQDLESANASQNALLQALAYYNRPLPRSSSKSSQQSKGGSSSVSTSESGTTTDRIEQDM